MPYYVTSGTFRSCMLSCFLRTSCIVMFSFWFEYMLDMPSHVRSLPCFCGVFFFKQKTAYEMRISDWSSDVCSSDLGDFGNRDIEDVEILPPDQIQQQIERALESVQDDFKRVGRDVQVLRDLQHRLPADHGQRHFLLLRWCAGSQARHRLGADRYLRDRKSTRLNSSH